jgi:radical SAM superfamily enzyme YgiQ (UPF0313 family)
MRNSYGAYVVRHKDFTTRLTCVSKPERIKMLIYLIDVRDKDYYHLLGAPKSNGKIKVMAFPPLGIQTLAPVLRQHGHEVKLFDTCHPQMDEDHIRQSVTDEKPDVIALSFLSTTTYPCVKQMARRLKAVTPEIPIIAGGAFATVNAVNILKDCPEIDAVGAGEGEELLPEYLENLDDPGVVESLSWRKGEEIIENPARALKRNLDQYPYPDRDSLPIEYIESMPLDVPAVLSLDKFCTVQTSRGCPYQCIYCDIPALAGGKWRYRSPEHVLGELQQLEDAGYRSVYFTDDHFLLHEKRIQAICQGIIDRKLKIRWGCEGRVDALAVNKFPVMARANCTMLAFGVEAGTQKVLDRLKKNQTLDQIRQAVDAAKKYGIDVAHGFFLIGSPEETKEEIIESFRFAARLKLDTFGFNRLCVYRGTPLWQEYIDRGIINDEQDWYKWLKCSDIDPTVLPGEILNQLRKKGYQYLFLYRIFRRPIKTFNLLRKFSRYMKMHDIFKLLWSPFRRKKLIRLPELTDGKTKQGLKPPLPTTG